jgi:phosphoglycolate phosphatase
LQEERIDPGSACMVGDRRHDVEGARAHGIPCLGVLWGYGSHEELRAAGALRLVESIEQLPAAIRELGADATLLTPSAVRQLERPAGGARPPAVRPLRH